MARIVLTTEADVVHVVTMPLAPLGAMHKRRFGSHFTLDVTERPGAVAASGSLAGLFAKIEKPLLGWARPYVDLATAVVKPDVQILLASGYQRAALVRNAPMTDWRAPFVPSPPGPMRFLVIGSIFEGRGYEMLVEAAARARTHAEFTIHIYGPGRDEYVDRLRVRSAERGLGDVIFWHGPTSSSDVSATYLSGHVGLVLYESDDPGNDGLSNKILECVATGRPVLAGDLPQNREFVEEHGVGWLSPMTTEDLASSLVQVASCSAEQLTGLSAHARSLGDTTLSWEADFQSVLDIAGRSKR